MEKHTALPWSIDGYNTTEVIAEYHDKPRNFRHVANCQGNFGIDDIEECKANAHFIIEACNNHYRLLDENKRLTAERDEWKAKFIQQNAGLEDVCKKENS